GWPQSRSPSCEQVIGRSLSSSRALNTMSGFFTQSLPRSTRRWPGGSTLSAWARRRSAGQGRAKMQRFLQRRECQKAATCCQIWWLRDLVRSLLGELSEAVTSKAAKRVNGKRGERGLPAFFYFYRPQRDLRRSRRWGQSLQFDREH